MKQISNYGKYFTVITIITTLLITQLNTVSAAETSDKTLLRRGELIKMLLTNAGYTPTDEELMAESKFTDVEKGTWYVAYGNKAAQLGMVTLDTEHTTLKPKETVSRAEALKMALHIAGIPTPAYVTDEEVKFSDVEPDDWFAPYAVKAIDLKIFDEDKFFRPAKKLNEEEAEDLINTINEYTGQNAIPQTTITVTNTSTVLEDLPHVDIFSDVWDKVINNFYAPGGTDVTEEDLGYGAIKGLVDALGDQHTVFQTPEEATTTVQSLNGEFVGIGVYISDIDNAIVVTGFTEESPAEKEGILVDDVIIKIDDVDVTEKNLEETAQLIRGEEGTSLTVTVKRESGEKTVTITRKKITVTYTQNKVLPYGVWYIKFSLFSENTATEIENAIAELNAQDSTPDGLILDLRYNPGGYLDATQALLSHFIPEGEPLFQIANSVDAYHFVSSGPADLAGIPVVVLVNSSSASAAEITAAVLQETVAAKIVGTQSYGKATTQGLFSYSDGSLLKLTIAEWLTPNGTSVNGVGVTPDFVVERDADDLASGNDPQLNQALAVIDSWF